jgi:secreted Zn-dependent insulinase-like peptidase
MNPRTSLAEVKIVSSLSMKELREFIRNHLEYEQRRRTGMHPTGVEVRQVHITLVDERR